ncbi:PBSX family phage terminase large subunit [Sediminibacillus massiliensis]|uniref:PBSX family phage terminase large subunit n=1 Tax=Sediminibacillus massiliensis TaxID=1926277 RepID=UPI0009887340|nr:PBSX family phage terminase large subunit [Sediminibacillus massiliensis]
MATMTKVKVGFNKSFKEANQSKKRYRIMKGSAGSGKSVNVAQDFIIKLSDPKYKGANLLCVRKVDVSNRHSTFSELKGAINKIYGDKADNYWYVNESAMTLKSLVTGNEVIFRGVQHEKDREKLKSINFPNGKLTWIWIEEATELYEADVDILDDRLRGILENPNLYYQITMTFNPVSAQHWIKKKYFDYKDDDIFTHHSTYLNNRFIDEAYHRRMERRKEQDPEGYRIYGLGEWGEVGGLILTNIKIHEFESDLSRFDSKIYSQDFGYNHANAILDLGYKDGDIFVCDEIYEYEKDTDELIKIANERGLNKRLQMPCDSAEPDRIKMWKKAGYRAYPVKKGQGSVNAQIDWLKQRTIHIHPRCVNTIKEIHQWKWRKDEKLNIYLDEPVNIFDDAMAALRYGGSHYMKPTMTFVN